jgi:rhamnose transport system permease protein
MRYTRAARRLLMLGDNPDAAALYGVSAHATRALAFAILGGLMGLSAVFSTARFGQVQSTTGVGYELEVIAAAVIGGANIQGGRGTVVGAVLGAALIGLLGEARAVLGIHERWQLIGVGTLMLAAISFEAVLARLVGGRQGGADGGVG